MAKSTASASNSTSGAATTSAAPTAEFDNGAFVYHIDILLLCLFGLYVLTTLPRAIARYSYTHGFFQGISLRSGSPKNNGPYRSGSMRSLNASRNFSGSGDSHTYSSHANLVYKGDESNAANNRPPTRVPRWATVIHPLVSYCLNYRVAPGMSLGKVVLSMVYIGIIFYAQFYKGDSPFTASTRPGFVGTSQFPIIIALAMKNNVLSYACGLGYEKLNYLHRLSGRLAILAINVHALGYIYKWTIAGTVATEIMEPKILSGLIGLVGADMLFFFSLPYIRQVCYHFFFYSHVIGFLTFMIGGYMHFPPVVPYATAALVLYAADHFFRFLKTRYTTAVLIPLPSLGATHISMPYLTTGWRAGQHIRLRIAAASGWGPIGYLWAWTFGRARPFSIATAPEGNGLELVIKKRAGKFTGAVYDLAQSQDGGRMGEKQMDMEAGFSGGKEVRVLVEGPYSGPGYTMFTAYSGAVLVAGGSGVSFILSVLEDMLQKHAAGRSRLRVIEVIWSVADPATIKELLPTFAALLRPRPSPHASLQLRITVHYTRAPKSLPPSTSLPAGLRLLPSGPNIVSTVEGTIDSVISTHAMGNAGGVTTEFPSGVIVGSCGPVEMGDQASDAVGKIDWKRWREVGGVETYEEVFGW